VLAPVTTGPSATDGPDYRPTASNRLLPTLAASLAPGWQANWPRFRGPEGTGRAPGRAPPAQWNGAEGEGILWKTAIPLPGWNSPIVWGDRVLVSGADETRREVYALDLNTGAVVWRVPVPIPAGVKVTKVQPDTGYAPATMATDGARICAVFVGGDVACLDMKGKLLWTRGFGSLDNPYGHASSPVIFGSGVLVQLDQGTSADDGKSLLMALDLVSGRTVWQIKRPVGGSWSTPLVITVNGKEQVITTANPWVIAYDPHSGQELWRADCLGGEVAVSAVFGQGYVVVANQGSNSAAIRPDGRGDVTRTAVIWKAGDGLPDIVSPLVWDDLVLLVTTDGFLTCVEVKTGKRVWEGDLERTVRASPVFAAGRIYVLDAKGVTHILQPGREFKVLGRFPLGEEANATPAFVGKRIVFRGKQHIVCVGSR
jgi:outer membrane protein assembly factor BamB